MKEIVRTYILCIKHFERLMVEKYELNENPWLIRRKFDRNGKIGKFSYNYHGAGCRLDYNGIICDYNIAPLNGRNIKFTSEKFEEFLQSHPLYKDLKIQKDDIEKELSLLVKQNFLSFMTLDGVIYETYQVEDDKWPNSFI